MTYKRKEQIGDCTLYLGDCIEVLPTLSKVDCVITDPPYPNNEGHFVSGIDAAREAIKTDAHQLIFWSEREQPLTARPDAVHIWHRTNVNGKIYEPIFEYGSGADRRSEVFRSAAVFNGVGAGCVEYEGHPTQKGVAVMKWLCGKTTGTVCDPFMGSGTTGVACVQLGRKFIGIEIDEGYFDITCERISRAERQPDMFVQKFEQGALI